MEAWDAMERRWRRFQVWRDARWVLRRCARRGHVLAEVADPGLARDLGPLPCAEGQLLRCLRCGLFVDSGAVTVAELLGSQQHPAPLSDLPLAARGPHGRRFGLLRLLAVERAVRGLLMLAAGIAAFQVAEQRGPILSTIQRLVVAALPLGEQLGIHITQSWPYLALQKYLGGSGDQLRLAGMFLIGYGLLEIIEGIGLWGGWRWAEYFAAVATTIFIPLEVYELFKHPTAFKAAAFALNVFVVVYLVYKGRLFGVRGGHGAYLRELRDATLLADLVRAQGRSTDLLSGTRVV